MAWGDKKKFINEKLASGASVLEVVGMARKAGLSVGESTVYALKAQMGQAGYTNGTSLMAQAERLTALRANISKMQAEEKALVASMKKAL